MKVSGTLGSIEVPQAFEGRVGHLFPAKLVDLLVQLHERFEPQRQELLQSRRRRQQEFDKGAVPQYLDRNSEAVTGDWKVAEMPKDLQQRRVEITGPVNSTKMVINMLSRNADGARADMAMLDFEDSMKPSWPNVLSGFENVIGAAKGELVAGEKKLNPDDCAGIMVRVRGLHLDESNVVINGQPISAGLFDLVTCFFHTAKDLMARERTPKYYVPKCEHYVEARWWNALFVELERSLDFPISTLRATFLMETLTAAFQIEEILFEIKDHAAGFNVGRWDKIFSDIKVLKAHGDRIMADRAQINMHKYWMDNYAKRLIKICHERGAWAIGGMSAFTPGKEASVREQQTHKVFEDKKNEFSIGHDGCWVSHPYFIGHALKAFPKDNQSGELLPDFDRFPDLLPKGEGPRTLQGLRTNVRVGIAYMKGWNEDIGCVAWDNLMEDLATLEISRAQTWQWLHHGVQLESGETVTTELIGKIFAEEGQKIQAEVQQAGADDMTLKAYDLAAQDAQKIFTQKELADFLTTQSEIYKEA